MQLVIDLPERAEQLALNRQRWAELIEDRSLAQWVGKIETNAHGLVIMNPPPSGDHSSRQGEIAFQLRQRLQGRTLPECPISTIDGVRAADVGWYSDERYATVQGQAAFETAPEICVEVASPSNTRRELLHKRKLYFDAGAVEVWLCGVDGAMEFFHHSNPDETRNTSHLCEAFPSTI